MRINAVNALVIDNLKRNRLFLLSALIGVAIGVSVLIFFTGLGLGVETHLVPRVFDSLPETTLKLTNNSRDLGIFNIFKPKGLKISKLKPSVLDEVQKLEGVKNAYGEMTINFPIKVSGSFLGKRAASDLIATGVEASVVANDLKKPKSFAYKKDGAVPVVVSRKMLDLYNHAFAPMNNFPQLGEKTLKGFHFDLILGRSYLGGVSKKGKPRKVQCKLVGFSNKAVTLGITVPLEYVKQWNKEYTNNGDNYQAIYIDVDNPELLASLKADFEKKGYKVTTSKEGASAYAVELISFITTLFAVIAGIIMLLAALNLAFLLFLMVHRRMYEIGLWRIVGATRIEMSSMVLFEALFVGVIGAILGSGLGYSGSLFFEKIALSKLQELPFVPEQLFHFPWWIWFVAVGWAVIFTLLGAIAPALLAAKMDPIKAIKR